MPGERKAFLLDIASRGYPSRPAYSWRGIGQVRRLLSGLHGQGAGREHRERAGRYVNPRRFARCYAGEAVICAVALAELEYGVVCSGPGLWSYSAGNTQ
jgi:hypothetical protein